MCNVLWYLLHRATKHNSVWRIDDFLALDTIIVVIVEQNQFQTIAHANRSKGEKSTCIRTINPNGKHEKLYKNRMDQKEEEHSDIKRREVRRIFWSEYLRTEDNEC